MKDISIIITAFERPQSLMECVESIRRIYPDIHIIVSDNGHPNRKIKYYFEDVYGCEYIQLDYDSGANLARKTGFERAKTKYAVICEDDFRFDKMTDFQKFRDVLEADPKVGLISGMVVSHRKRGIIKGKGITGSNFRFDKGRQIFYRDKIIDPNYLLANETRYFYADYVRMFFMKRKEMEIDWEENIYRNGSGSHMSIFMKLMDNKFRSAFTPDVEVIHKKGMPDPKYRALRQGRRKEFKYMFYKSTGFRYGVFNRERVIDYKENKRMSFEDFRREMRI